MDDDPRSRTQWRGERDDPYFDASDPDDRRLRPRMGADDYVPQRGTPAPTLAVLAVLALIAVGLGIAFGTGLLTPPWIAAEPSATPSPSASAAASPSPSVAASPTAAPTPAVPGGLAPDALVATTVDRLTLRGDPGLAGEAMWVLPEGAQGFVISGPVAADGYDWYQLSGLGLPYGSGCITPEPGGLLECPAWLGWLAAAGTDGSAWLAPTEAPPCPTEAPSVEVISFQMYTMRLVCHGSNPLTFRAWWPEAPSATGGTCPAAGTEVEWLACPETNPNSLGAAEGDVEGRLQVSIDPASGVAMPERGQWIELTAHFDDAAAQGCAAVGELRDSDPQAEVFTCRLQLVVSEVAPSEAP